MSEFDPTKREHINISPLRRFDADVHKSEEICDFYMLFTRYLEEEFGVSSELADDLFSEAKQNFRIPDQELFETDMRLAQEQMRLSLIRVALPLAESLVEDDADFTAWVVDTARIAMDVAHTEHDNSGCVAIKRGYKPFGCTVSPNCPVVVTKHTLLIDSAQVDFGELDYDKTWAPIKIGRTLAKLDAAFALDLVLEHEVKALRMNYLKRCGVHELPIPETGDL